MKEHRVLVGAKHPIAGMLYLEVIPDSEVGLVDIYRINGSRLGMHLNTYSSNWRQCEPDFYHNRNQPWHEWVIQNHLSMVNWCEDREILSICHTHNILCSDLHAWANDVRRWMDVHVMVETDSFGIILNIEPVDQGLVRTWTGGENRLASDRSLSRRIFRCEKALQRKS